MRLHIEHLAQRQRFQAVVDGMVCVADYRLDDGVLCITHTEVPGPLQGRGIAAALMRAVLDHAAAGALAVRPLCSYARSYMRRHPGGALGRTPP
jgi:predicted GNAT family acetyltransferase